MSTNQLKWSQFNFQMKFPTTVPKTLIKFVESLTEEEKFSRTLQRNANLLMLKN